MSEKKNAYEIRFHSIVDPRKGVQWGSILKQIDQISIGGKTRIVRTSGQDLVSKSAHENKKRKKGIARAKKRQARKQNEIDEIATRQSKKIVNPVTSENKKASGGL